MMRQLQLRHTLDIIDRQWVGMGDLMAAKTKRID